MANNELTSREIAALETAIAIAFEGRLKPRRDSERDMVIAEAKAGLAKLRAKVNGDAA